MTIHSDRRNGQPTPRHRAASRFIALGLFSAFAFTLSSPVMAASCGSTPEPGLDWSECSKKNLMLSASELEGANLAGTDFSLTDLSGSNLASANLEKATLVRAWLAGAKAEKANFGHVEAYRSSFANIVANGASFVGAELQRTDMSGAQLSGADFSKAELGRVNFKGAVLTGAKFSVANLSRANFNGVIFEGPIDFEEAFMFLTHIEGVDLSAATGLHQTQIDLTCGDESTKLPEGLKTPTTWPCASD